MAPTASSPALPCSEIRKLPALLAIDGSRRGGQHGAFLLVREHKRSGSDDASRREGDAVSERGVDADEAVLADGDVPGDHGMRCDEAVVRDNTVMTDVISAPKNDVGSD